MPPLSQPKPAATAGVTPLQCHVNAAGQSHLLVAASVGDVAKVRSLLAASGGLLLVDLQDKDGISPLYVAFFEGHMEVVRTPRRSCWTATRIAGSLDSEGNGI